MTFRNFKVNHPIGKSATQIILEFEPNEILKSKDSTILWELWRENEGIFLLPLETFTEILPNNEEVQIFYIKISGKDLLANIGLLEPSEQYKIIFFKKQCIGQFKALTGNTFSSKVTEHNLQFAFNEEQNEHEKVFNGFLLRAKKDILKTQFSLDFYLSSKPILSLEDVQVLEIQKKESGFILNDWNIRPNHYVSYELRQKEKSFSGGTWVTGENEFFDLMNRMIPSSHQKMDQGTLSGFIEIFSHLLSGNYTQAKAMRDYFDLDQAPSYLLPALVHGLGMELPPWPSGWKAHETDRITRTLLKQAIPLYQEKGTKKGLERLLQILEIKNTEIYEDRDFLFFSYSESLGYTYCKTNGQFYSLSKEILSNQLRIVDDFNEWDMLKLEKFLKTYLPFTSLLKLFKKPYKAKEEEDIQNLSVVQEHLELLQDTKNKMLSADLAENLEERGSTYVVNKAREKNYMAIKLLNNSESSSASPILHTTWNERDDIRRYQFQAMVKCTLDSIKSKLPKIDFFSDWDVSGKIFSFKKTKLIEVDGMLFVLKKYKNIFIPNGKDQTFYIYLDPELEPLTKFSKLLEKKSLLLKMSQIEWETAEALVIGEKLKYSLTQEKYILFSIQYDSDGNWKPQTFYRKLKEMPDKFTETKILDENIQAIRLRPGVPITHEVWNATDEVRRVQTREFFKCLFNEGKGTISNDVKLTCIGALLKIDKISFKLMVNGELNNINQEITLDIVKTLIEEDKDEKPFTNGENKLHIYLFVKEKTQNEKNGILYSYKYNEIKLILSREIKKDNITEFEFFFPLQMLTFTKINKGTYTSFTIQENISIQPVSPIFK